MTAVPAIAYIGPKGAEEAKCLKVHFNPTSLKISLSNQFGEDPPEQHAKPTTTKLDVELIFDTTETGADVRTDTDKLRLLATAMGTAKPAKPAAKPKSGGAKDEANFSLPMTAFHWGTTQYLGVIESLTETLDYWSSDGVPLRSAIQLSMKGSAKEALTHEFNQAKGYEGEQAIPELKDVVPAVIPPDGKGVTGAAAKGGDSNAGRMLAANNGLENMRLPLGGFVGAAAGVQLSAAAGFQLSGGISAGAAIGFGFGASAGASLSAGLGASVGVGMAAGAGIGLGASAGIGFGASAGIGFGASAGAGIGFGASAGAGIGFGASAGASAGFGASAGAGMSMGAFAGGGMIAGTSTSFGAGASFGGSASMGIGMSGGMSMGMSGGGLGITTSSTTSVTGFDGVTRTETQSTFMSPSGTTSSRMVSTSSGSSSAGIAASQGAFMGLGMSKTTTAIPNFNPDRFLGDPAPSVGPYAQFTSSGRLVTTSGQVAASYTTRESVVIF